MALENLPHVANTPGVAALSGALIGVGVFVAFWIAAVAALMHHFGGQALYVGMLIIGLVTALKDGPSNLLAGVMILLYRPFRVGNRIAAAALEGIVASIDLRYTTLRGDDRRQVLPNAMLFTNSINV